MNSSTYTPEVGDRVSVCGYSFVWTKDHLSKGEIEPLRQQHDSLATAALERIQVIRARIMEESKVNGANQPPTDLYSILADYHHDDAILAKFWDETKTVPSWVDWEQIERGQRFFHRYAIANIVGFALQGFMAENSAAPGVVEVLVRTGGFSTRMLLGRLIETFQWLIQVTQGIYAIQPGGEGHIATIRVRLLHAAVRQRILQLSRTQPNYFDIEKYGVPVNLLDGVHSISTFCCNPMWLQLPKFGITPRPDEIEDYIALFRYIGYLLGVPTSYFETAERGKIAMETFLVHELHTTETSRTVAFNFLECVSRAIPAPFHVSKGFIEAGSRWINGHELCDELQLAKPNMLFYVSFGGHCILVTMLAWMQRVIPGMDEMITNFFRDRLYRGIVQRKSRTRFDFKYIPKLGKRTGKEVHRMANGGGMIQPQRRFGYLGVGTGDLWGVGPFEMALLFVVMGVVAVMAAGIVGSVKWMNF